MFYYSRFLAGVKKKTWQAIKFLNHFEICYILKKNHKENVINTKGEQILEQYKGIIDRHPKKNL